MKLSVFSDELWLDAMDASTVVKSWGSSYIDFRGRVNGRGIEYQSEEELKALKAHLDKLGLKVGAIQSSLCKVHLPDKERVDAEMEKLEGLIRACRVLDCKLVRTFNFWQPAHESADLFGQLCVRPDEMAKVLELFGPFAKRAKEAGLILAFENCGQSWREVIALVKALGVPEWGLAWDPNNDMPYVKDDPKLTEAYFLESLSYARMVHVKAVSLLPDLDGVKVPWERVMKGIAATGDLLVSVETHNPKDSPYTGEECSKKVFDAIGKLIPTAAPASMEEAIREVQTFHRSFKDNPVRYVVVGLGMGTTRCRQILQTEGCELYGVCDINAEKAKARGEEFGVRWSSDINDFLTDPAVEVMYVVTPTGLHCAVAEQCLRAGKHVLMTKPMDVDAAACRHLISVAKETGLLVGLDFDMRMDENTLSLKKAVDMGWFGHIVSCDVSLFIHRTQDYYDENGAWRGTWAMDGGGAMCNQGVHDVDMIQMLMGVPKRVRAFTDTLTHRIECEDIGFSQWEYEDGRVVRFSSTTTFPVSTWYRRIVLHGTKGAYVLTSGGPDGQNACYANDANWRKEAPYPVKRQYRQGSDAFACAVRGEAEVFLTPEEGLKSRLILDALYKSARSGGAWVEIR